MGHTPTPPNKIQVDPHHQTHVFTAFCPSFMLNDLSSHPSAGNGLVYPRQGDEPIQKYADRPFFWITSGSHRVAGNLWDWIIKADDGNFYIVHGHKGD